MNGRRVGLQFHLLAFLGLTLLACSDATKTSQGNPRDASMSGDGGRDAGGKAGGDPPSDASSSSSTTSGSNSGATAGATSGGQEGRGPAYAVGTADCPPSDGTRRIKLVNNCTEERWFKLDGRTTPTWARPTDCPWAGASCTDPEGITQCTKIAKDMSPGVDPGLVYCKANTSGGSTCACNPYFRLGPGEKHEIPLPNDASFPSGTGWLASGCNARGAACLVGGEAARNSTFEFTYDKPKSGSLYYDISAVNAWTQVSNVGMKSCGEARDPKNVFWCSGTGCRFDVNTECPDGTATFAPAPSGCKTCVTKVVNGKQVLDGPCGACPNGASGNSIPTGTVFNANNVGGNEWTWNGSPSFASTFGSDQGNHANRRFSCTSGGCTSTAQGGQANTCLGGCDLCTTTQGVAPGDPKCIKYCCPDGEKEYGGFKYRYDSAGCTALGVQAGTDYTATLKSKCPYVYTYGYEDHSSTFQCSTDASLLIQACPDARDFPASLK